MGFQPPVASGHARSAQRVLSASQVAILTAVLVMACARLQTLTCDHSSCTLPFRSIIKRMPESIVASFESLGLHPIIVRNLSLMDYKHPKPIQEQAIEPILTGRDVIGLAQTGTGKTAAFIAPIAHHLISSKPKQRKNKSIEPMSRLRALVLCPTRELAQQVADETATIVQGSVLRTAVAYGKTAISTQVEAIARGIDILIATPGRVRELLESGDLSLSSVKYVAIDEGDRMLDMGFLPQVTQILQTIAPESRQTLLFTATMPDEIAELAAKFLREPVRIEVGRHTTPVTHVKQHLLPVDDRDKVGMLLHLIQQNNRRGVLVFCRTRRRVGWVGTALERNNVKVGMLHGDRSQAQRKKSLDRFTNNEFQALVATDVASRGLHIPAVKTVVNYDLPLTPEDYVHRIGRAGHGGGFGEAYSFLSEDDRQLWRAILRALNVEVFAEELEGFEPQVDMARGKRKSQKESASVDAKPKTRSRRSRVNSKTPKRSRKGRPIKQGQLPGKGVIRTAK